MPLLMVAQFVFPMGQLSAGMVIAGQVPPVQLLLVVGQFVFPMGQLSAVRVLVHQVPPAQAPAADMSVWNQDSSNVVIIIFAMSGILVRFLT